MTTGYYITDAKCASNRIEYRCAYTSYTVNYNDVMMQYDTLSSFHCS